MDALLFLVIMVAGLAVAALVIGRAQRAASPDDPTPPKSEEAPAADDWRDRPAGPGAEVDQPHPSPEAGGSPELDGGDGFRGGTR